MKNILICAAALCLFTLNVFAENKIHGSNEFSVNYNNLDGPGKTSSSLTQGARYLENLNLYGNGSKNSWNYNYSFGLKATDDKKNDLKTFSLTNLNSKITNNIHTLNTGDVFESFTRYSLGSPLKGLSYNLSPKNKSSFNITALHGIAYPRWDSFWGDPEVKTVKRTVSGIRTKKILTDDIEAGFNYVFTKDTDRQSSSDGLYDAKTYSFDFEYDPMPGLTVNAERAQSDSDYSSSAGTAYSSSKGHATRIEAIGDGYPSRVVMEYENVSPDFISLLGSAISDRRKFKSSWRYNYSKKTTMNWSFLWYRNNLDSQLTSTTRSWKPQIGIAIKRIFPKRRYSFVDFYYKFDRQYGAGQSSSNHYFTTSYRDRFGEIDNSTNLGYSLYKVESGVRKSNELTFNTSFNSTHDLKNCTLRPSLNLGVWRSRDELTFDTDNMYNYSLGLAMEAPAINITSQINFGQNILQKESGTNSKKFFANLSTYYRPSSMKKLQSTFFVRAGFNDFSYTTTSQNFRETAITMGINSEF